MPKISAIMPVYNGEKYVAETIESILNQSFTDFEYIIVNDGSTDRTREIIESFLDERIKLFNLDKNMGVGYASNYALNKTSGKYIARVDSDDIYHRNRFYLQNEFLDNNPSTALVKSLVNYFPDNDVELTDRYRTIKEIVEKDKNSVILPEDISKRLYFNCCIPHNSIMVRSEVIKEFGYKNLPINEDYQLFYSMNLKGYRMATINKCLVEFRVSNSSTTVRYRRLLFEGIYTIKKDIINKLFTSGKVFLWGAGSFGEMVYDVLKHNSLDIEGFIDSDPTKQGVFISGKQVFSSDIVRNGKDIKILVTSQPGMIPITNELENRGFEHLKDYLVYM